MIVACPVDGCEHLVDATPPDVPAGTLAGVFGPGVFAAAANAQHAQAVEDKLRRHLDTHQVVDFVRTITALRTELGEVEQERDRLGRSQQALLDLAQTADKAGDHFLTTQQIYDAVILDPADAPRAEVHAPDALGTRPTLAVVDGG